MKTRKVDSKTKVSRCFNQEEQLFVKTIKQITPLPDNECTQLFLSGEPQNINMAMTSAIPIIMKCLWNQPQIKDEDFFDVIGEVFVDIRTYFEKYLEELSNRFPFSKLVMGRTYNYILKTHKYNEINKRAIAHIPWHLMYTYCEIAAHPDLDIDKYSREKKIPKKVLLTLKDLTKKAVSFDEIDEEDDKTKDYFESQSNASQPMSDFTKIDLMDMVMREAKTPNEKNAVKIFLKFQFNQCEELTWALENAAMSPSAYRTTFYNLVNKIREMCSQNNISFGDFVR